MERFRSEFANAVVALIGLTSIIAIALIALHAWIDSL